MKRMHIIVHGRVQGVGFRFFTQQQAEENNIKGWVRNKPDGTVEAEAEGEPQKLDTFINKIKAGSPFSKVTDVHLQEINDLKNYKQFSTVH